MQKRLNGIRLRKWFNENFYGLYVLLSGHQKRGICDISMSHQTPKPRIILWSKYIRVKIFVSFTTLYLNAVYFA